MVVINFDINPDQLHSCNLKGDTLENRLIYLSKHLFGKAKTIDQMENKITLLFPYDRNIAEELVEFAFFEKQCCGNYTINMQFDMIKDKLKVNLIQI